MEKSKVLRIRVDEGTYQFLKNITREINKVNNSQNFTISSLIRNIINYFFLAYSLNEIKTPLRDLIKKFRERTRRKGRTSQKKASKA